MSSSRRGVMSSQILEDAGVVDMDLLSSAEQHVFGSENQIELQDARDHELRRGAENNKLHHMHQEVEQVVAVNEDDENASVSFSTQQEQQRQRWHQRLW